MNATLQDIAPGIHIRQYRQARFDHIVSPLPGIIRVEAGEKRVEPGAVIRGAGHYILLPEHMPLSVENRPPLDGPYAATALAFPRHVFEAAYERLEQNALDRSATVAACAGQPALHAAFENALSALSAGCSGPRLDLLCEALALEAALAGAVLPKVQDASLTSQLRSHLSGSLAAQWTAERAARDLGISPATLRRGLRAEGAAFNEVLRDLRLASGLHLLQTTRWSVASVAQAVGYSSASRFAQRFRTRFGLAPGDLRKPCDPAQRIET